MRLIRLIFRSFTRKKTKSIIIEAESHDFQIVKVCNVFDGDSVKVSQDGHYFCIRLAAIDAPEDGQPWGEQAKWGLIKLIAGSSVLLETYGEDVYGRTLATMHVMKDSQLINVNEELVKLGHAWVARMLWDEYLPKTRQIRLNRLEDWAKSKRKGLWRSENPIPPWEWRNQSSA